MDTTCKELLKAMRGRRSQSALSRQLGYSYNQVNRWESGQKRILWNDFIRLAKACNVPLDEIAARFISFRNPEMPAVELLPHLIGDRTQEDIMERMECSRFQLSRWLSGKQEPPLKLILSLVDLHFANLPQFISAMVPIDLVPSLKARHDLEYVERNILYERPYVAAVLHSLSLKKYKELDQHKEGFISNYLGITVEEEISALKDLERIGRIQLIDGLYVAADHRRDIAGNFEGGRRIRAHWALESHKFIESLESAPERSVAAVNTFTASNEAILKIREKYLAFFQESRSIIEMDKGSADDVWVLNFNIFTPSEKGSRVPDQGS